MVLTISLLISSCANKSKENDSELSKTVLYDITESSTSGKNANETTSNSSTQNQSENIGGSVITVHKYRVAFNSIPQPFIDLVGEDVYYEWSENIDLSVYSEDMAMLHFIKDFEISRENFDKANLKWAKIVRDGLDGKPCLFPKDYANQETDEVYNADIIYTFDESQIKEYYLGVDYPFLYEDEYEEAVENGEYTSQTEDWIDVEQMEADIIAKYGSVD